MVLNMSVGANRPTFEDCKAKCIGFGKDTGKGADAYVGLLVEMMEGTYHGAIDPDSRDKHGKGIDDVHLLVGAYMTARGNTQQFKGKSGGERKILSNGRKLSRLGACSKWGNGQPLANVSDLMFRRNKEFAKDAKNTDDAANTLLKYATAQLKSDTLIDGDALNGFCRKNQSPQRATKAVLKGIIKQLQKVDDPSQELKDATTALVKRVGDLAIEEAEKRKAAQ
jgi:hypothetical protein